MPATRQTSGLAFFTLFLSLAGRAHAQESAGAEKSVVLVADPTVRPLARRLQQEVESLGLVVRFQAPDRQTGAPSVQGARASVVATIRVATKRGGDVDMTVIDEATGKTVTYQLVPPATLDPAASELIATRTVELLRAHLLKLTREGPSHRVPPVSPAPSPEPAATGSHAALSVSLGPTALFTPKFRPGAQLQAKMVWLPVRHFGVMGAVLAPLSPPRLNTREGAVALSVVSYRLGPIAVIGSEASPVSLRAELGVEIDALSFEGQALAPYRSATNDLTTWAPFVSFAPRFRAFTRLYVAPEFSFAFASPATIVRVAGVEETSFGRPVSRIGLLLELTWPRGMP